MSDDKCVGLSVCGGGCETCPASTKRDDKLVEELAGVVNELPFVYPVVLEAIAAYIRKEYVRRDKYNRAVEEKDAAWKKYFSTSDHKDKMDDIAAGLY